MGGLTSPVKAPESAGWTSCAPRAIGMLSASSIVWTERRAVKLGWTETSARS